MIRPDDVNSMSEQEKIELLGMLADGEETPEVEPGALVRLTRDTSPEVRRLAVQTFWDVGEEQYIDLLVDVARNDPSLEVQSTAASVLGIFIYHGAA